jgi:flagellar basal body rod protein FlgG
MGNYSARHDVISHNLANVSTAGFARQDTFLEKLAAVSGDPFAGPIVHARTEMRGGPPLLTDNPLDLSLEGSGFFVLQTAKGDRLSRIAELRVNSEGFLIDGGGHPVLGENGVLQVGEGRVQIEPDGSVLIDGTALDRLRLLTFASGDDVHREPEGLWSVRPGRFPTERMERPVVRSGQIEGSAVEPISELVGMIQALRAYEAAASAVRATDRTLERAVNDIARI